MTPDCVVRQMFFDESLLDEYKSIFFSVSMLMSVTCMFSTYVTVKVFSEFKKIIRILSEIEIVDKEDGEIYEDDINEVKIE